MIGRSNTGGGGGKLFAVIAVTYPEGSICTCSDGTKTMKAKDTSGKALFNVAVGEWTVTATDGSSTASKAVSITYEGQVESVSLSYTQYLYNKGDECKDITGGWGGTNPSTYFGTGTVTKNADNINVSISSMQSIFAHTINKISLTGINTIYANILGASNPDSNRVVSVFAVGTTLGGSYAAIASIDSSTKGYISIDVSALEGDYYVYFRISSETYSAYVNFDEVYME